MFSFLMPVFGGIFLFCFLSWAFHTLPIWFLLLGVLTFVGFFIWGVISFKKEQKYVTSAQGQQPINHRDVIFVIVAILFVIAGQMLLKGHQSQSYAPQSVVVENIPLNQQYGEQAAEQEKANLQENIQQCGMYIPCRANLVKIGMSRQELFEIWDGYAWDVNGLNRKITSANGDTTSIYHMSQGSLEYIYYVVNGRVVEINGQ